MATNIKPFHVLVEVVSGPAGPCLCIGDNSTSERVAGPKPWGGGSTVYSFQVAASDLRRLADEYEQQQATP
jgi:hypothetical protein